jgi:hypothetical protein
MVVAGLLGLGCILQAQDNATPAPAPQAEDKPMAQPQSDMQKWIAATDAPWQAAFKRDVADVHEAELNKVKLQYLTALDDGLKKASAASDLKGALALRNEQKRSSDTQALPEKDEDSDTAPVKAIRAKIRTQLAQVERSRALRAKALHAKYDQVLAQAQTQLTKAQRLDDALLVEKRREEVKAAWLGGAEVVASRSEPPESAKKEKLAPNALDSLSIEDQQVVKSLSFSHPEAAPLDTRTFTYIKGRFGVENSGPKRSITGALVVEMRMLCRNKDKAWSVIAASRPFDVNDAGEQSINVSFPQGNDLLAKLNGSRNEKIHDSYTAIRYKGVLVYEVPGQNAQGVPKDWWKDDTLIYKK